MTTVLFACVHNAGRSQIAAAFFNSIANPSQARALSAGTSPAAHVHPEVIGVMREVGLDLSGMVPQLLTPELASQAHYLITMGCGDACPVVPGTKREDWPLQDPKAQSIEDVRRIREEIRNRVIDLVVREHWDSPSR